MKIFQRAFFYLFKIVNKRFLTFLKKALDNFFYMDN